MSVLDDLIQSVMDDFFSNLSQDMDESKYKSLDSFNVSRSPLTNLYGWLTDDYSVVPMFRSGKAERFTDTSGCFDINTLNDVVKAVKFALNANQGYDAYESYSHNLHIALFKYKAKRLDIRELHQNCVELHLKLSGFNWLDVDQRYFEEDVFVNVPLRYLFNKKVMQRMIYDGVYEAAHNCGDVFEDMFDIDNLEFLGFSCFTVVVGNTYRSNLNSAIKDAQHTGGLKAIISHMTDAEVVYFEEQNSEVYHTHLYTEDSVLLDCIRIYYLMVLYNLSFSAKAFRNYVSIAKIKGDKNAEAVFDYVEDYLKTRAVIERNTYYSTYTENDNYPALCSAFNSDYFDDKMKTLLRGNYISAEGYAYYSTFLEEVMGGVLV